MARQNNEFRETKKQPEVKKQPVIKTGVVKALRLNVRKEAKLNAEVTKILSNGDTVKINVDESTDNFYKITDGYVMKKFIEIM